MESTSIQTQCLGKISLASCYSYYESNAAIAQYCDAHYGPDKFGVANFPAHLAHLGASALQGKPQRSALDLGCAVGRTSFELATCFDQVTGIDFSSRFIDIANRLKERGRIGYIGHFGCQQIDKMIDGRTGTNTDYGVGFYVFGRCLGSGAFFIFGSHGFTGCFASVQL